MYVIIMIIISVVIGVLDFNGLVEDRYTSMIMDSDVVDISWDAEYEERDYKNTSEEGDEDDIPNIEDFF